jgi:LPS O-antigen subunit length determinant protein (WzzB/FepE family)
MSLSEIVPTQPRYPEPLSQEIDFMIILDKLLQAKKQIVIFSLIFAFIGALAAFLLPQKWTSQAIITPPEQTQLTPLRKILADMQALGVEVKQTRVDVFNYFIKEFSSRSQFQDWLMTSPPALKNLVDESADAEQMHQAIVAMAERMQAKNNTDAKHPGENPWQSWTLSFTAKDAGEAQQMLSDYMQYMSTHVRDDMLETLRHQLNFKVDLEKEKLAMARETLLNQREVRIQRLKYALEIANTAGIKKPVYGEGLAVQDDPDYSITLGADGLAAKLQVEKSLTDVSTLNADIRNREYLIGQLSKLAIPKIDIVPFKYLLSPSLPVKHDGPGRMMVILLAAMVGFVLACGYVLMRHAFVAHLSQSK